MPIYIRSGDIELAFGVSWMPEASNKGEQAAFVRKRNPNYSVTCQVAEASRFGVARRTKLEKQKIPVFSAAFLFTQYLQNIAQTHGHDDFDTAILAIKIRENDVAIVALLDGQIYRDEVVKLVDAEKTISGLGIETNRSFVPFSNLDILPDASPFSIDSLEVDEKRSGELKPIRNIRKGFVVTSILIAFLAAVGFIGHSQYRKSIAEDEAAQNKVDPVKAYSENLERSLSSAGWEGKSAYDSHWLAISVNPISLAGWDLQTVDCTRMNCRLKWKRLNGSNQDFQNSNVKGNTIYNTDGTILSSLDLKGMSSRLIPAAFPRSKEFSISVASWDQDNKPLSDISGLTYVLTPPAIYALPAGTTADQIPTSLAVLSGRITITTRLGVFAEVLRDIPANIALSGINFDLTGGSGGSKVTISGEYFVKP